MHWLTAIFGLVSGYTLAGFIYTLTQSGEDDSLLFFGIGFVLFVTLTAANEILARRKTE